MRKGLMNVRRSNTSLWTKVALTAIGLHFARKFYPELRRYVKLHEM